jgi:hypothetical protein
MKPDTYRSRIDESQDLESIKDLLMHVIPSVYGGTLQLDCLNKAQRDVLDTYTEQLFRNVAVDYDQDGCTYIRWWNYGQ